LNVIATDVLQHKKRQATRQVKSRRAHLHCLCMHACMLDRFNLRIQMEQSAQDLPSGPGQHRPAVHQRPQSRLPTWYVTFGFSLSPSSEIDESASGGRMSTRALLCLCRATDEEGFSSSRFSVLRMRT
jgi:hypothetical protein